MQTEKKRHIHKPYVCVQCTSTYISLDVVVVVVIVEIDEKRNETKIKNTADTK